MNGGNQTGILKDELRSAPDVRTNTEEEDKAIEEKVWDTKVKDIKKIGIPNPNPRVNENESCNCDILTERDLA